MDYGGQYSTTSYGAQGGAGGGGFMGGSQGGSQTNPAGKGTYGKDTLRPVSIMQTINAQQPHPDAEFSIDDVEITQITFVGQIRNISTQATNIIYKLDDGTGTIEVKQWVDIDPNTATDITMGNNSTPKLVENEWARVWGRLKDFNNKRHVGAHVIRPVIDKMEIIHHLLEATYVHLYFTRGPLEQTSNKTMELENGEEYKTESGAGRKGQSLESFSPLARRICQFLQVSPQTNEGLHVQNIAVGVGTDLNEVLKAVEELRQESVIYPTVDDHTWALLDF